MRQKLQVFILVLGSFAFSCQSSLQNKNEETSARLLDSLQADSLRQAQQTASIRAWAQVRQDSLMRDTLLDLKNTVTKLAEENRVESAHIGAAGSLSMQWVRFEHLKKIASTQELVALAQHPNATIRCYAFRALVDQHSSKSFPVLLQHLHDTARVSTLSGCNGSTMPVYAYFVRIAELTPKQEAVVSRLLPAEIPIELEFFLKRNADTDRHN